jgi:adenylate cyclase
MDPLVALTLTPTHHYYFFILLSTLRLKPWLSVFTGAVAALEYFTLAVVFLLRAPIGDDSTLTALPLHMWKASLYLMAGAAAGFVAWQVRKRVANALRSVEDQKRVRDVFGKHVSPQVVDQLLRQDVTADGEVRHVCVMFLDIRDFTARSSRMRPEDVVGYLNTLFDFMIECINRHNGIVNKFLGDGFMAVFGAPVSDGRDSHNAVTAAREILERVEAMNAFGGDQPTRVGMGLHAGPVLAGNVGSALRKEYTIIGDTVNLASRIESLNKQFGSSLLISEEVWREVGDDVASAERLGPVAVKGKEELVPVYRLA